MAASLPLNLIKARIRRRLQKVARDNGGTYAAFKAQGATCDGYAWTETIDVIRASNGESFGMAVITITAPDGEVSTFRQMTDTVAIALSAVRQRRRHGTVWLLKATPGGRPDDVIRDPLEVGDLTTVRRLQWEKYGNRPDLWEAVARPEGHAADLGGWRLVRAVSLFSPEANPE